MTQVPRREIESGLLRKGFKKESSHHSFFRFYINNKKTSISTFVSHGSKYKDINDDLLAKMKRELRMPNKRYFIDFIECPITEEQYKSFLVSREIIKDC